MQVCECNGEEWKSPTPDILAWGLFTSGSSRVVIGNFSSRGEGSRFSYDKSKGEESRLAGDCNPWVSKMLLSCKTCTVVLFSSFYLMNRYLFTLMSHEHFVRKSIENTWVHLEGSKLISECIGYSIECPARLTLWTRVTNYEPIIWTYEANLSADVTWLL
jgi:hypothetical protein